MGVECRHPPGREGPALKPRQPKTERAAQFDLMVPEHAYAFGLFQTDGHLCSNSRNRGNLSLELSSRDADILPKLAAILPVTATIHSRERTTNFTNGKLTSQHTLRVHDWGFRLRLVELGLPAGKKSELIAPPATPYSVPDYWRGVVDGDGSLGITGLDKAFMALVTASDPLADGFKDLVEELTGYRLGTKRNARDGVYNLMPTNARAQILAAYLYYDGCLAMGRKLRAAQDVASWRPAVPPARILPWTGEEDTLLMTLGVSEAIAAGLSRTPTAAYQRLRSISVS